MKTVFATAVARLFLALVRQAHKSRFAALAAGTLALLFAPLLMRRAETTRAGAAGHRRDRVIDGEYRRERD